MEDAETAGNEGKLIVEPPQAATAPFHIILEHLDP